MNRSVVGRISHHSVQLSRPRFVTRKKKNTRGPLATCSLLNFILEKQLIHILLGRSYYRLNLGCHSKASLFTAGCCYSGFRKALKLLCLLLIVAIAVVKKLYMDNDRQNSNPNKLDPLRYIRFFSVVLILVGNSLFNMFNTA